jgi:hypothetical protein
MRTASKVLIAIGVALAVLAGLWLLIAPGQLVKYPNDLDKTAVAEGTFTQYLGAKTGLPLLRPRQLPLTINRRLHVVSSNGSRAVVKEDSSEKIGPLPPQDLQQQYVISRTTLKNLQSGQSYVYAPQNVIDRAPAYSINLPFDTGAGPYEIWKNEVGRSYTFRQQGDKVTRYGVTLIPLQGGLTNAPAQSYYLNELRALGLPTHTTIQRLTPQLKAVGLDPAQLTTTLLPRLSADDRAAIVSALSQPIGLRYVVSVKTRLLVEPATGAIVSLDNINQTLGVQPSFGALRQIAAILSKPQYLANPVVKIAGSTLAKLAQSPPTTKVFNITYGQTPASVADIASYAKSKADGIAMVKTTIPLLLLIAGVLSAAVGLGIFLLGRRGQGQGAAGAPATGEPVGPNAAPPPGPATTPPRVRGDREHRKTTDRPSARH